jgi:hypothetical protein
MTTSFAPECETLEDRGVGLVPFPLLADPQYEPNTFEYCQTAHNDMPKLADWIDVFRRSIPTFKKTAERDTSVERSVEKAALFESKCETVHTLRPRFAPTSFTT